MGDTLRFAGHEFEGSDASQWPIFEAEYPEKRVESWERQRTTGEKAIEHAARILGGIPVEGQLCIPFPGLDNEDGRNNGANAPKHSGQLALSGAVSRS